MSQWLEGMWNIALRYFYLQIMQKQSKKWMKLMQYELIWHPDSFAVILLYVWMKTCKLAILVFYDFLKSIYSYRKKYWEHGTYKHEYKQEQVPNGSYT